MDRKLASALIGFVTTRDDGHRSHTAPAGSPGVRNRSSSSATDIYDTG